MPRKDAGVYTVVLELFHPTYKPGKVQRGQFRPVSNVLTYRVEPGKPGEPGRVVLVAPAPNRELWNAVRLYTARLETPEPATVRFEALTLERFGTALVETGTAPTANAMAGRYFDLRPARDALAASMRATPLR